MDQIPSAGLFNRRIVIESPSSTPDATGFASYGENAAEGEWSPVVTCWASIQAGAGVERRESDREINESPTMIFVRYGAGRSVTASMRARNIASGAVYDIRDVSHVMEGRRLTQLTCRVIS
jgi:head-tail adaptor